MNEKQLFNDELIETTYLWRFKRLNNRKDSEDLAQEILFAVLESIGKKAGKQLPVLVLANGT